MFLVGSDEETSISYRCNLISNPNVVLNFEEEETSSCKYVVVSVAITENTHTFRSSRTCKAKPSYRPEKTCFN